MESLVLRIYWMISIAGKGSKQSYGMHTDENSNAIGWQQPHYSQDFIGFPKEGGSSSGQGMIQRH